MVLKKISLIFLIIFQKVYTRNQTWQSRSGLVSIRGRPNWISHQKAAHPKLEDGELAVLRRQSTKIPALESQATPQLQRDREKGQGSPASPAALLLTPAHVWDQQAWFQEGSMEAAALLTSSFDGKCRPCSAWSTIAEHCSCTSQKIWAVTKSCQRAANPYNCSFSTLRF